jgi:hypothetical protein
MNVIVKSSNSIFDGDLMGTNGLGIETSVSVTDGMEAVWQK